MAFTSEACSPCDFQTATPEDYGYIWDDEYEEYLSFEEYDKKLETKYAQEEIEDCEDSSSQVLR